MYGSPAGFAEVRVIVAQAHMIHSGYRYGYACHTYLTEVPGTDMTVKCIGHKGTALCGMGVQNSHTFRVQKYLPGTIRRKITDSLELNT